MSSADWAKALADAHARMHTEHEIERHLLDDLERAVAERAQAGQVHELLRQLVEHTNLHFLSEQLVMRQLAYPGLEAHEQEHDDLMAQARQLQQHVEAGEVEPTLRFIAAMRHWLTAHMAGKDQALARYLAAGGS
jgi:hemerythrin